MSAIPAGTKVAVSATAPGTSRRALLLDDESAWTAPATPATITLRFPQPVSATKLGLTFQGGFVASTVTLEGVVPGGEDGGREVDLGKVYPEDVSRRQVFDVSVDNVVELRLELAASSDHHGRVTLYHVELLA